MATLWLSGGRLAAGHYAVWTGGFAAQVPQEPSWNWGRQQRASFGSSPKEPPKEVAVEKGAPSHPQTPSECLHFLGGCGQAIAWCGAHPKICLKLPASFTNFVVLAISDVRGWVSRPGPRGGGGQATACNPAIYMSLVYWGHGACAISFLSHFSVVGYSGVLCDVRRSLAAPS